jgi:protein-tyrosine phosphatase
MVDIHCHILPNVDDGSRSWEITEQMCAIAVRDGVDHIVATPHASPRYAYDRHALMAVLDELRAKIGSKINFSLGCDFHLSYENLQALHVKPEQFVIGETKYLLIELNDFSIPPNYQQMLFRMHSELGITPILTHPERHPLLQAQPEQVQRWVEAGCLVQVTANSLTGSWGRRAKAAAMWLLKKGLIHVIATDAHDTKYRPPVLSEAREVAAKELGSAEARRLVEENPRAIVEGRDFVGPGGG